MAEADGSLSLAASGTGGPPTAWILTDGKAGDEAQCLGVVDAMGLDPIVKRVSPRPLFAFAMPWGPIDPRDAPARPGSPIAPPFPDLLVASGRRAVPYIRAVKRASRGRTYTVVLKDPRTGMGAADLIWAPAHDRLRGPNVIVTATAPHRITAARLEEARRCPDPRLAALGRPLVAILVGGDSHHHRFTAGDVARLAADLRLLVASGAALAVTASRRTPPALRAALAALTSGPGHFLWDGEGQNPYLALLANADAIVATVDSTNMIGEAVATGAPVLLFEPSGGHVKIRAFLDGLAAHGAVRPFTGRLEGFSYQPLDTTPEIARAVAAGLERHLAAVRTGRPEF